MKRSVNAKEHNAPPGLGIEPSIARSLVQQPNYQVMRLDTRTPPHALTLTPPLNNQTQCQKMTEPGLAVNSMYVTSAGIEKREQTTALSSFIRLTRRAPTQNKLIKGGDHPAWICKVVAHQQEEIHLIRIGKGITLTVCTIQKAICELQLSRNRSFEHGTDDSEATDRDA